MKAQINSDIRYRSFRATLHGWMFGQCSTKNLVQHALSFNSLVYSCVALTNPLQISNLETPVCLYVYPTRNAFLGVSANFMPKSRSHSEIQHVYSLIVSYPKLKLNVSGYRIAKQKPSTHVRPFPHSPSSQSPYCCCWYRGLQQSDPDRVGFI